jgi:hypothetical protein
MNELDGLYIWIAVVVGFAVYDIRQLIIERCNTLDQSIAELKRQIEAHKSR